MKSKINFKSLLAGMLIGAGVMGSVSVFADLVPNSLVEAWIQDTTHKILIDGKLLDLGADNHIINYQGRIYTPARLVSEAIGAEVQWDDLTNTVIINSPEPEIIEVEVEKEVYIDYEKAETQKYEELPARTTKANVTFNVLETVRHSKDLELQITINNDSKYYIYPNVEEMYIEDEDGVIYNVIVDGSSNVYRTGIPDGESAEKISLYFQPIPKDMKNLKVYMSVDYVVSSNWSYETQELTNFTTYFETDY